jgi:hypothetical protein
MRYRIPNTEDVLEVVVEYEEGSTMAVETTSTKRDQQRSRKIGLTTVKNCIILVPGAPYNGEI